MPFSMQSSATWLSMADTFANIFTDAAELFMIPKKFVVPARGLRLGLWDFFG